MQNHLLFNKRVLICEDTGTATTDDLPAILQIELENLKQTFFGIVMDCCEPGITIAPNVNVYLTGNIAKIYQDAPIIASASAINVIKELSNNYDANSEEYSVVNLGEVPINIANVGIYFRKFFSDKNYFDLIQNRHHFVALTESNKPNLALRRGIYLSKVTETDDGIEYNLLRCSSNLDGPTDNFRDVDTEIITQVNLALEQLMSNPAPINHVLAQIYYNNTKTKARISAHSDKTKDMPPNGVIGFCTFYDNLNSAGAQIKASGTFDYCYKSTSVLSQLVFKLKSCVTDTDLVREFTITLYPNSLFVIPLSTNRLYTHEIRPSTLPANYLKNRMGYVMRCSDNRAIYKDGATFITNADGVEVQLGPATKENTSELRKLYFEENTTANVIDYGFIDFSMNSGDYVAPLI